MDFSELLKAISSVGFPIVAFFYCFHQNNKQHETDMAQNSKQHEDDMAKLTALTDAVNSNSKAISDLVTKIEVRL